MVIILKCMDCGKIVKRYEKMDYKYGDLPTDCVEREHTFSLEGMPAEKVSLG